MLKDRALDALKAAAVAQAESAQLRAQLMLRQPSQADVRLHCIPLPQMAVDSQHASCEGAATGACSLQACIILPQQIKYISGKLP